MDILNFLRRVLVTLGITLLYCIVWTELEKLIDGQMINRTVDNIVMFLFIPIIYIATEEQINDEAWETAMDMIDFEWEEID